MAKRNRPKTPEQIAAEKLARRRAELEAVNMQPEAAELEAHADTHTERAGRKSGQNRAWRSNVFRLLLERKTITADHFDAAYILTVDWAMWRGLDGKVDMSREFVDGGAGCRELITDRMLEGRARLYGNDRRPGALTHLEPIDRALLEAFMLATVEEDRPMAWRGIVQRVTAEVVRDRQTQAVVRALEALRRVYQEPRKAA